MSEPSAARLLRLAVLVSWLLNGGAHALANVPSPPEADVLCVGFLSYNRPHYLVPSVKAFVEYTRRVEPNISHIIHVLDNGSGPQELHKIHQGLLALEAPNLRLVHLTKTVGLARGFNLLFYDLCGDHKFMLSMEDDWRARGDWPASLPAIQLSMGLLQKDPSIMEVWIRDFYVRDDHHQYHGWQPVAVEIGCRQLDIQVNRVSCPPGSRWGVYTNGASVKYMPRLRQIGRQPVEHGDGGDGENLFAERACKSKMYSALICSSPGSKCLESGSTSHDHYVSLFEHIGHSRVSPELDSRSSLLLDRADQVADNETLLDLAHTDLPVSYYCHKVGRLGHCCHKFWIDSDCSAHRASTFRFVKISVVSSRHMWVSAWLVVLFLLLAVMSSVLLLICKIRHQKSNHGLHCRSTCRQRQKCYH